jgi:hypothetical protein
MKHRTQWTEITFDMIFLALVTLFLSACAAIPQTGTEIEGPVTPIVVENTPNPSTDGEETVDGGEQVDGLMGYEEFVAALEDAGASVEEGEALEGSFFDVPSQVILVNGVEVQVLQFADTAAQEAASSQISDDGTQIGNAVIRWVDQPNFWAKDSLIVLYVGRDAQTIDLLIGVLGQPVTVLPPEA